MRDRHMHINIMDWDAFMTALWVVTVIGVGGGLLYVGRRLYVRLMPQIDPSSNARMVGDKHSSSSTRQES